MKDIVSNQRKLKIVYDVTIMSSGVANNSSRSGIFFVGYNILMKLMAREDIELHLFCFKAEKEAAQEFFRMKSPNPESWEPIDFIRVEDMYTMDVYISPVYAIPKSVRSIPDLKKYVILYDTIPFLFPEYYPGVSAGWIRKLVDSMDNQTHYFAISENTKKDFLKLCESIPEENFSVIKLSIDESMLEVKTEERDIFAKYGLAKNERYVLSLCSLNPRKNVERIVRSFLTYIDKCENKDLTLIVAGEGDSETLQGMIDERHNSRVILTGYVDDGDKAALYENAEWFVYTPQYEGFGMPPLEAMSFGCPVVVSNNSSLPEVVGEAGILIDWDSDEQHVQAYEKMSDSETRNFYRKKAIEQSRKFSWTGTVQVMLDRIKKDCFEETV